jgi:transposase
MAEITRSAMAQVGVDPSKRVFQVHAVDRAGRMLLAKAMSPDRFFAWCAELPAGCLVAMEACGGAHHVARRLRLLGLDARLVAGHFVTPYRMAGKSGKSDANDAAAICEAAGRPHMRFVPVKTTEQQGQLAVHRLREGFKEERTALINRIRGLLAEFGLVFAQSPEALRAVLADVIEDASNELPGVARLALQRVQLHWIDIELQMSWCDERIASHVRSDERACEESCHFAGYRPDHRLGVGGQCGRLRSVCQCAAVRRPARAGAQPELHRRQGQVGVHHQTRRRLPAHTAHPGGEVRGDERRQTI